MSEVTMSIREYTKLANGRQGLTTFSLHADTPTDATSITALTTATDNLGLAVDAVVLGTIAKQKATLFDTIVSSAAVTAGEAQREKKWLVTGTDGTDLFSFSIGTADLNQLAVDGSNELAAGANRTALEAAIEALWTNDAGDPITVTSIRYSSVRS